MEWASAYGDLGDDFIDIGMVKRVLNRRPYLTLSSNEESKPPFIKS